MAWGCRFDPSPIYRDVLVALRRLITQIRFELLFSGRVPCISPTRESCRPMNTCFQNASVDAFQLFKRNALRPAPKLPVYPVSGLSMGFILKHRKKKKRPNITTSWDISLQGLPLVFTPRKKPMRLRQLVGAAGAGRAAAHHGHTELPAFGEGGTGAKHQLGTTPWAPVE